MVEQAQAPEVSCLDPLHLPQDFQDRLLLELVVQLAHWETILLLTKNLLPLGEVSQEEPEAPVVVDLQETVVVGIATDQDMVDRVRPDKEIAEELQTLLMVVMVAVEALAVVALVLAEALVMLAPQRREGETVWPFLSQALL